MDEQLFLERMKEIVANGDEEAAHSAADKLIVEILHHQGLDELATVYETASNEWYYS